MVAVTLGRWACPPVPVESQTGTMSRPEPEPQPMPRPHGEHLPIVALAKGIKCPSDFHRLGKCLSVVVAPLVVATQILLAEQEVDRTRPFVGDQQRVVFVTSFELPSFCRVATGFFSCGGRRLFDLGGWEKGASAVGAAANQQIDRSPQSPWGPVGLRSRQ